MNPNGRLSAEEFSIFRLYFGLTFFGPIMICLLSMGVSLAYLHLSVLPGLGLSAASSFAVAVGKTVRRVTIYPLLLLLCWLPNTVLFYLPAEGVYASDDSRYLWCVASFSWGGLSGLALAVAFFSKSEKARADWWGLLSALLCRGAPPLADLENEVEMQRGGQVGLGEKWEIDSDAELQLAFSKLLEESQ